MYICVSYNGEPYCVTTNKISLSDKSYINDFPWLVQAQKYTVANQPIYISYVVRSLVSLEN